MEETTTTTTRPQVQKPRLEIPDSKLAGSGSSPRSMHGFPLSPQSPDNSSQVKSFEDWSAQSVASPGSLVRSDIGPGVEKKSLHFYVGEFVLVRCNQTKWLLGQVRRSSRTGVIVWVGAAQTLVNVPYDLLVSHLVKLDSPSQPASPPSSISTGSLEVNRRGQLMAPFLCVRPAHLSHRKLYHPLRPGTTCKVHAASCSMNFHSGPDVESSPGGKVMHSREIILSSQEPSTSSTYTPGNIQIFKEFKAESYCGAQVAQPPPVAPRMKASPVAPQSVPGRALCGFKFQQEEKVDDSFRGGWLESDNKSCWITVIENGLDIRKKATKY